MAAPIRTGYSTVVIEVGHLAGSQALTEVQRIDVGVAVRLVLLDADVPGAGPAGMPSPRSRARCRAG